MSETKTTSVHRRRTTFERVGYAFLGFIILFLMLSLYQWHVYTELLRSVVTPVSNGDDVCDEWELPSTRVADATPCGQYLQFLISVNNSI
jgi:hypothetical protein